VGVADGAVQAFVPGRLLIVDDEQRILNFVSRGLRGEGFEVDVSADGEEALRRAATGAYDIVILDLLIPGMQGTEVLRRLLQHRPEQSVIVLSALGDTGSKVTCLDLGAEDYISKPFSLEELLARVRARLRQSSKPAPARLVAGRLVLDLLRREASVGGRPVPVAEREFMLLQELMRHAGRTLSKEYLLSAVWGYHFDPGSNVVEVYVRRLRRKLGAEVVITVRGDGYRVAAA
jgi:DNA-binding response OmpR family regulator